MNLSDKVAAILAARGVSGYDPLNGCRIEAGADGQKITLWNTAALGPVPSASELEAIAPAAAAIAAARLAAREAFSAARIRVISGSDDPKDLGAVLRGLLARG